MLVRKLMYEWTCNKCGKKEILNYDVFEYEEYPAPHDPPLGWAKTCEKYHSEHFCSKCYGIFKEIND